MRPAVHVALVSYINQLWRPNYERWVTLLDGSRRLANGYLFPSVNCQGFVDSRDFARSDLVERVVQPALKKAGICGPNAHCHAFRKGVITALLSMGNSLDDVAVFVHHTSPQVTKQSYDLRTYGEIVGRLQVPAMWIATGNEESEYERDGFLSDHCATSVLTETALQPDVVEAAEACLEAADKIEMLTDQCHSLEQELERLRRLLPRELWTHKVLEDGAVGAAS